MNNVALGCSHTYGTGVDRHEAWPALLNLKNYGSEGCSIDYIARMAPYIIEKEKPLKVFALWPDWTRFEYIHNDNYVQSLPTDNNRVMFMEYWTDAKLKENFKLKVEKVNQVCHDQGVKLIGLTLDDLIPYIDHADRWPISKLGHHYSPQWHEWVADIFRNLDNE